MLAGEHALDASANTLHDPARASGTQLIDTRERHNKPTLRRAVLSAIGELFLKSLA
jgi:hypothetical protein